MHSTAERCEHKRLSGEPWYPIRHTPQNGKTNLGVASTCMCLRPASHCKGQLKVVHTVQAGALHDTAALSNSICLLGGQFAVVVVTRWTCTARQHFLRQCRCRHRQGPHMALLLLLGQESSCAWCLQTGTGKSHTMEGRDEPPELRGIIPNTFDYIFQVIGRDSE